MQATRQSPGAVLANHAAVTVDVVATVDNVTTVANSLPLATFVPVAPTELVVEVDYRGETSIARPGLLDRIQAYLGGVVYDGVVVGITDEITPDRWTTTYTLAPGMLLDRTYDDAAPVKPSPVRNLTTTSRTTSTITLHWDAPTVPGGALGYVIRRATGTVAPTTPTDGTGVGAGTLDLDTVTITDTGRASSTDYAYAVFVVTEDPDVWTRATVASWTLVNLPTATGLTIGFDGFDYSTLVVGWTASTLDTQAWDVTVHLDNGMGGTQNLAATGLAAATRSVTIHGVEVFGAGIAYTLKVTARRSFHGTTTKTATKTGTLS